MRPILALLGLSCGMAFGQVEPNAGNWKTWAISSSKDHRVPPPPGEAQTQAELAWLRDLAALRQDPAAASQIQYWNAGPPVYKWVEMLSNRQLAGQLGGGPGARSYAYLTIAIYDATIAAWEAKYQYRRQRPTEIDANLGTVLDLPKSHSYPSDYAATAFAAAAVMTYFLPAEAATFQQLAEEAGRSRLIAGLEFPSDYEAGMALGRRVAEEVIRKARQDGSDVPWTGTVPTGPCRWVGTNPGNAAAATWKPILLSSPSEFRPPVPPACDSANVIAQTEIVRQYPRDPAAFTTNYKAFYWQSPDGLTPWPFVMMGKFILEDQFDTNPPRAARAYALLGAVTLDIFIASQDGKFAYWYPRPHMLDSRIVPLFASPNFPAYPSNHSSFSTARAEVMAYLFPQRADHVRAVAKEAGDSRIWAGIHFDMDNSSGVELGRKVAAKFIAWAESDGSRP
jgi:membrane-associated phospholipid phosphatase